VGVHAGTGCVCVELCGRPPHASVCGPPRGCVMLLGGVTQLAGTLLPDIRGVVAALRSGWHSTAQPLG
jgi:hypothetical protein